MEESRCGRRPAGIGLVPVSGDGFKDQNGAVHVEKNNEWGFNG